MPKRQKRVVEGAPKESRIEHLVVCRESDESGYVLMEGMIGQTLGRLGHLPGVDEVLAAGLAPLRKEGPFSVFSYRKGGTQAVLFEHQGVMYLYSLGSAAKANIGEQENAFVSLLVDVIDKFRPKNLYVATFSRLVRSTEFAGSLQGSLKRARTLVHIGDVVLDLNTQDGMIRWSVFSLIADMERTLIVQRLFAGRCNKYARGKYILGDNSVPPGYVLNGDDVVELDKDMVEPVRTMLLLMADHELSDRQVLAEAGRAGVTSLTIRRLHGDDATYSDIRNPGGVISTLVEWLPTYASGVCELVYPNPFPGARQIGSLMVEGATEEEAGKVRLRYQWPVPKDGWAPAEVLAAAARRAPHRRESVQSGGAAHRRRKPLAGWVSWCDERHQYQLMTDTSMYIITRDPLGAIDKEVE